MADSSFKLFIIPTIIILVVFGLVIGGYFVFKEMRKPSPVTMCVIMISNSSELFRVDGQVIAAEELRNYLLRRARNALEKKGSAPIHRFTNPYELSIEIDPGCRCNDLWRALGPAQKTQLFSHFSVAIPGGAGTRVRFPTIPDRNAPTIDAHPPRLKLIWYSPNGYPRYTKPDGRLIVKVRGRVFDWVPDKNGDPQPDWNAVTDHLKSKVQSYRPPAYNPDKMLALVLDCRRPVPMHYFLDALKAAHESGLEVFIAAPEIPY